MGYTVKATPPRAMVSCVLATRNRRRFLPQALRCFLRQTYRDSELVVVDDSDRPAGDLCLGPSRVRYIRLTRPTATGRKLNLGIEAARGEIIQKLDDDDYYGPGFLATSVAHLPERGRSRSLVARCCFLILMRGDPIVRHSGHGWSAGGSFCFHRALWERQPFRNVARSEDAWLIRDAAPRIVRVCDAEQYIVVRHGRNTWNDMSNGDTADNYLAHRRPYDKPLRELMPAADRRFYRSVLRWPRQPLGCPANAASASSEMCQTPRP